MTRLMDYFDVPVRLIFKSGRKITSDVISFTFRKSVIPSPGSCYWRCNFQCYGQSFVWNLAFVALNLRCVCCVKPFIQHPFFGKGWEKAGDQGCSGEERVWVWDRRLWHCRWLCQAELGRGTAAAPRCERHRAFLCH